MTTAFTSQNPCPVVVLISGSGSNLQALIDDTQQPDAPFTIAGVISSKPEVLGLERAQKAHIPTQVISASNFSTRETYDHALLDALTVWKPALIVLAGFMRVLGNSLVEHYAGRMFNIHPSLLPKYPGLHTHERVLAASDPEHGCTVHFVIPELDAGPIVAQAKCKVRKEDDPDSLKPRVQALEHKLYPKVVRWFAEGRVSLQQGGVVLLDGTVLPKQGMQFDEDSLTR